MLNDCLVCGVKNVKIKLSQSALTYTCALEIAQREETVAQNLKELQGKIGPR